MKKEERERETKVMQIWRRVGGMNSKNDSNIYYNHTIQIWEGHTIKFVHKNRGTILHRFQGAFIDVINPYRVYNI